MELEEFILSIFEFAGSIDFNMFSFILGAMILIFWLIMVGWVWVDSAERTSKKTARAIYILLVVFLNIPGLIIYLIVRPSETIEEIYWADLERRYLKYETAELGDCPKCGHQLLPGFVFCTNCGYRIKRKCHGCGVLISKDHKYCEFCGAQIRERAAVQEQYPDIKVMEEQIQATKEHATQTVESKRTKYKTGRTFVVKLGEAILGIISQIKEKVKTVVTIEEVEKTNDEKGKQESKKDVKKEESKPIQHTPKKGQEKKYDKYQKHGSSKKNKKKQYPNQKKKIKKKKKRK